MADEGSPASPRDAWAKAEAAASIASKLLIPVVLVIIADLLSASLRDRELSVKESDLERAWVQLALDVLGDESFAGQRSMRDWSVAVINHYVPEEIRLTGELQDALVRGQVSFPTAAHTTTVEGQGILPLQAALKEQGLCGPFFIVDGAAGLMTQRCLADFLGGAPFEDVRALLSGSPELLLSWVAAGTPPADWRNAAGLPARAADERK